MKDLFTREVSTNLHRPNVWDVGPGLCLPPSCAFYAPLYVIVVEEELHNFLLFFLVVDHNPSVFGGCRDSIALNDLCLVLLLRNSLSSKKSLS
jgi:hypothetical protein